MALDLEAGSSQYVHYGDSFDSVVGGADKKFSLAGTFTAESLGGSRGIVGKNTQVVVFTGDIGIETQLLFIYRLSGAAEVYLRFPDTPLSPGTLYRWAIAYDGSVDSSETDRLRCAINGVMQTVTVEYTLGFPFDIAANTASRWIVGAFEGPTLYSDGSYSDFALWEDELLTDAELLAYSRGYEAALIRPEKLVWAPRFVRDALDPRGATATLVGSPVFVSHPRVLEVPRPRSLRTRSGSCAWNGEGRFGT